MYSESGSYIVDQASARLIPSFLPDIAKSTDKYNRVSNNSLTAVAAKVPGLRQTLPIKQNILEIAEQKLGYIKVELNNKENNI